MTGGGGGEVKGKAVLMEQMGEVEKVEMGAKGRGRDVSMRKTDSERGYGLGRFREVWKCGKEGGR